MPTFITRRIPVARARRGKPAALAVRFAKGRKVQVHEDFHDPRYAGRVGTVVGVVDERSEVYPRGRVAVRLVVDKLYTRLHFKRDRLPQPVWFRPGDLDRSPELPTPTGDF